jgi:hypothetical protein
MKQEKLCRSRACSGAKVFSEIKTAKHQSHYRLFKGESFLQLGRKIDMNKVRKS